MFNKITEYVNVCYESDYHSDITEAFGSIEKNGVKVTDNVCDIFDERVRKHISEGKLYSQYNLWTSTGRPSNSFGSVNFAALPPEKRGSIIPENDALVEYDFDAYHLRLIAELVDYQFGEESVHQHLADFYGSTYEESKQISFKLLYGGITKDIMEKVPFFNKVQDFIDKNWSEFNKLNRIKTNIYKRRISLSNDLDMNRNKLFNYLIQAFETERNTKIILEVQEYLKQKETKLVLYGYDSFLFDLKKKDGANILNDIKNILEKDNYPTKIKMGYIYNGMKDITSRL